MTDSAQDKPAPICCPHCGGELALNVTAQLKDRSTIKLSLHPHEGELLSAETVGESITDLAKIMAAVGKNCGVATDTYVSGLSFANGSVTVEMLVARKEKGVSRRDGKSNK